MVDTVNDLKALNVPFHLVHVLGWHHPHDGGGGLFTWASEALAEADNGLVISGVASGNGCWQRCWDGRRIDARWFGVKADGVISPISAQIMAGTYETGTIAGTDDTVPLQAAMNAARELRVPLDLPSGIILVADMLRAFTSIYGAAGGTGGHSSGETGTVICRTDRVNENSAVIAMAENTTIKNVWVRPKVLPDALWAEYPKDWLYAENCDYGIIMGGNGIIEDCRATGFVRSGLVVGEYSRIANSLAERCGQEGISVIGVECEIINSTLRHNSGCGIVVRKSMARVFNSKFEMNSQSGCHILGSNFIFSGNTIDRNSGPGLWIADGLRNGIVSNNLFLRNGCAYGSRNDQSAKNDETSWGRWPESRPGHYSYRPIDDPQNSIFPSRPEDSCHIKAIDAYRICVTGNIFSPGPDDLDLALSSPSYCFYFSKNTVAEMHGNTFEGDGYAKDYPGGMGAVYAGGHRDCVALIEQEDGNSAPRKLSSKSGSLSIEHGNVAHNGRMFVGFRSTRFHYGIAEIVWRYDPPRGDLNVIRHIAGVSPTFLKVSLEPDRLVLSGYLDLEVWDIAISS